MGFLSGIFGKKHTNPHTGEQHRSGLRRMFHAPHIEKAIRPVAKVALPIAGTFGGGMLGGPLGAILGGGVGGGLSSKKHALDHTLGGLGLGLGHTMLSPMLGNAFGVAPESGMGRAFMMNQPSLFNQLGLSNNAATGAGLGLTQLMGSSKRQTAQPSSEPGLLQRGPIAVDEDGNLLTWKDLLDMGLLGTSVLGALGARTKYPKEPSLAEIMETNKPKWGPEHAPRKVKPLKRKYKDAPKGYEAGFNPEWEFFEETNPQVEYYAKGGYIQKGITGGQDDDVPMKLPEGGYVWNATDVSLLGDGNSENGAAKLHQWENALLKRGGATHFKMGGKTINAKVSNGEYFMCPEAVTILGGGDNRKGSKMIDAARKRLRKQKGVRKILPPKAKDLSHYLKLE